MKINSISRMTSDPSGASNFFDIGQQPGQGMQNMMPVARQQSSGVQIFPSQQNAHSYQNFGNQPRVSASNQVPQLFDNDVKQSITSFDRNPLPKRPMSQVPTLNRGANSMLLDQSYQNQSINRPFGMNPQLQQSQQAPYFGQTQSTVAFSQSGIQPGMTRDALRENINKKGQLVNELTQNRNFFRDNLDRKNNEFKEYIRNELKKTVFDKVLKTNLHYIYKHYENLKTAVNRDEAIRILNTNLTKQHNEINEGRKQLGQLEASSKALEERLLATVNQPGVIKAQPTIVENITKEDMEKKVNDLKRENAEIEQALDALRRKREKEMYDLRMKHENKGRVMMEQRAIKLALQYVDPQDPEQLSLKTRIEDLIRVIEINDGNRKANPNYILADKKEKLEKELEVLKFYSA